MPESVAHHFKTSVLNVSFNMEHEMKLNEKAFTSVISGLQKYETRLLDEKRRRISVGDIIIFKNSSNQTEVIKARVVRLLLQPTFVELFNMHEPLRFGKKSVESLMKQVYQFYSKENEAKYGVVGIQIEMIK